MRQSDRASKADYEAEADLRLLLKQRLRRVLEQQPDSRKGRGQRWTSLLFPLYFLRWLANTILRRPVLSAVELSLREATQQSATLFPEPVVHVKGFVKGMNFEEGSTSAEYLVALCCDIARLCKRGGTLVWDGDSFNRDSFTIAVLLAHSLCPNITLATFLREGEKDRVLRSWKQRLQDAGVRNAVFVTCASDISYTELGLLTLRATRSKTVPPLSLTTGLAILLMCPVARGIDGDVHVFCLGGGGYLLEEYTRASQESPDVVFTVHPASRTVGDSEEQCSLLTAAKSGVGRDNLVLVSL